MSKKKEVEDKKPKVTLGKKTDATVAKVLAFKKKVVTQSHISKSSK